MRLHPQWRQPLTALAADLGTNVLWLLLHPGLEVCGTCQECSVWWKGLGQFWTEPRSSGERSENLPTRGTIAITFVIPSPQPKEGASSLLAYVALARWCCPEPGAGRSSELFPHTHAHALSKAKARWLWWGPLHFCQSTNAHAPSPLMFHAHAHAPAGAARSTRGPLLHSFARASMLTGALAAFSSGSICAAAAAGLGH